jgi:outer membrane receptor protein involved in Fe transport
MKKFTFCLALCVSFFAQSSHALSQSGISGTILDDQGVAVSDAKVQVFDSAKKLTQESVSGAAGDFEAYPIDFGDYTVKVNAAGFAPYESQVHVSSGGTTGLNIALVAAGGAHPQELTIAVKAKKNLVSGSAAASSREVDHEMIEELPEGDDVKLPKLLATTTPGIIQGPFGQTFVRGNHANIQYQIDGVQLPDSPSSTFGQAFSPRNIDHMEVITGGIPAEYGERLAAVVNIITKSGSEVPGGSAEMGYGAYNTITPQANYSGSSKSGDFHYYLSAAYTKTDRGLDTPQPESNSNVTQGSSDAIHDASNANDEFVKLDWQLGNDDKISVIAFNSYSYYEIPNFPSSFGPSDTIFTTADQFGNPPLHFVPSDTNDTQAENNAYLQAVWKHTIDPHSFLQLAPYFKFSKLNVTNDPTNDLFQANYAPNPADSSSFATDRSTNNYGLKGDYSNRLSDRDLLKAGFQAQGSRSTGDTTVFFQPAGGAVVSSADDSPSTGWFESLYVQDEHKLTSKLTLNAGIRLDATQFKFSDASSNDSWAEPRINLSYMVTETTKIHAFYGLLYQPAPVENLRDTFQTIAGNPTTFAPYDIKAEKDNYYEVGIAQQVATQVFNLNVYYKSAKNMLDDSQLLNTSIAQPYNFAVGYAYGVEFSVNGKITDDWSDYANYSYEIAKGKGLGGGLFASPEVSSGYQFLDHVQVSTANAGVTYKRDRWWWTGEGLFGSGLRTGDGNSLSLPSHFSADTSVGYDFSGDTWLSKTKLSLDLLNLTNNMYPITIANGFNGSHYSVGRELFVRLSKDI